MSKDIARFFLDPFLSAFGRVSGALPPLAAAFLLLLLGMFLARLARALTETFLGYLRLDEHTSRAGLNELLARLGLGKSPTLVISFILYWFILVVFVVSAANALSMTIVSDLLEHFVQFLPSLAAAILIFFSGLLFGRLLAQILANAAAANSIRGGATVAAAARVAVIGCASVKALEQLGARPVLIVSAVQISLAAVGLGLAIAFGLGAKEMAAESLRNIFQRRS